MRTTVMHMSPLGMQPVPEDNDTPAVAEQVEFWRRSGGRYVIHTQLAMEIASWYHTPRPGDRFSEFSHKGIINRDFVNSIDHEIRECVGTLQVIGDGGVDQVYQEEANERADALNDLHALRAYVRRHCNEQWGDPES